MTDTSVPSQCFMDHPEVDQYLAELLPVIISESDRGAILLGASQIDEQLKKFFEALLPQSTSNNRKKEIFSFTGPFGGLSAKLDVAYTCRLLPTALVEAIHLFRKLRNDLAHKTIAFDLQDHASLVRQIFASVGPGVDVGVSSATAMVMLENAISQLLTMKNPIDQNELMFKDREAVLAYIQDHTHHLSQLESQRIKWELALGIGLICGYIIYIRNQLAIVIRDRETFAFPKFEPRVAGA
ncbi:MAG: hypothetical protein KGL40_07345 [Rhodocyclaceae bacterium]|nr:hypothetical protein [Rhodocyclaceae bacterium]